MEQDSIVIRAANATPDESLAFARYLDEAAEGFFRFMLGPRSQSIIAEAFAVPGHDLSYQNATFAVREGAIVGMISGFTAAQHRRSSLDPLIQAAGRRNLRMRIVRGLLAPLLRVIDSVADGDYYLQAIAVDGRERGNGLGTLLLDSIEQHARDVGAVRLALDVSAGNQGAIRFYERHGMTVESQWPKRVKIPGLKLCRMVKSLGIGPVGWIQGESSGQRGREPTNARPNVLFCSK